MLLASISMPQMYKARAKPQQSLQRKLHVNFGEDMELCTRHAICPN